MQDSIYMYVCKLKYQVKVKCLKVAIYLIGNFM